MMLPPLPTNEADRLRELQSYDILDTLPERVYDDAVALASFICGTPISLVSLVDGDRQWFKARVGLDAAETPREVAFCAHAILQPDRPLVVEDTALDERFADNPLVTGAPRVGFYAGVPLVTPGGVALGTLCVIDHSPRKLTPDQTSALMALSRQVVEHFVLRRNVKTLEDAVLQYETYREEMEDVYQRQVAEERARAALEARDETTGLGSLACFEHLLDEELGRAARRNQALTVLRVGVDGFAARHGTRGEAATDAILRSLAGLLAGAVRGTDVVCRFGEDDFVVLLPGTKPDGAAILAERLRRAVAAVDWPHGQVSVSIGGGTFDPAADSEHTLMARVAAALEQARDAGGNQVQIAGLSHPNLLQRTA